MRVYVFKNSYYVGTDENVIKNALRYEDITVPKDKELRIVNGEISFVDREVYLVD